MAQNDPIVVPSSRDLERWYTPNQARERAAAQVGQEHAAAAVWGRVREGLIRCVARSVSERRDWDTPTSQTTPYVIPRVAWNLSRGEMPESFWTGDIRFSYAADVETARAKAAIEAAGGSYDDGVNFIHVHAFGMRLHPEDVDREFPPLEKPAATTEESAKPRVQDDWLKGWADLFNRLYPLATEEHSVKSAKGMFHDKQVARDRIRSFLPDRRPGPRKQQ